MSGRTGGLMAAQVFDESGTRLGAQHADTDRQFLERSIIAPHFARCNIFVLRAVKQGKYDARIAGCADNEVAARLW